MSNAGRKTIRRLRRDGWFILARRPARQFFTLAKKGEPAVKVNTETGEVYPAM